MIATTSRLQLRDYQQRAVDDVIAALGRRPILVSPTGSGKTTCGTEIVERLGVPTLWMAHRKELIDQAATRLAAHGLNVGIVMSGYEANPDAQVQVASIQTLVRRNKPAARLIVIDECHHVAADSYQRVLDDYPDAYVLGLTATPFRLDGRGLGQLFGELVVAAWPDELCESGVLHKPRVWASKAPDLRGVRVVAGDYSVGALAQRSNTVELNADIVETWKKHAFGRRTVAFAVDIDHSRAITQAFRDAGVPAEHLDGSTARFERDAILDRLGRGETHVVSNCMVLTEGWDLPALECAVIARPTASLNLHVQMIGRVLRACDGKDGAIVLDHAGNHHVHGLVTRRLNYTLSDEKVGFSEPLGLRRCGECGLLFETAEPCCPECGWEPETDCEVIHNVLHDLVVDFPFKTSADRENFFGLLLTPIVAPAIDGNRPMHLLNAPLERTGKSKLVNEVFGGIVTGRDTPSMQITDREEEREKRILAMLLQGETLMHLDNLPAYIDSPALASLLTTSSFLGRILGFSRNVSLPNNLTIVGTGNNVQASGEIAKRVVPIMIEPTDAQPEARSDFQHSNIRAYVRERRRVVLECLLGLVENWLAAGRPTHSNRLGGFESWSEAIGGILRVNGLKAWRTNEKAWREQANPGGSELEDFVRAWYASYDVQEVDPQSLRELAKSCRLFQHLFARRTEAAIGVAFGRMLSRHVDRPVASWYIRRTGATNHSKYYLKEIK